MAKRTSKKTRPSGKREESSSRASLFSSQPARIFALYFLLALATVATYYPVSGHPFLDFDDSKYVTQNAHVQAGITGSTVQWAFTTYYASNWHPLTWLSHALDCQMFGLSPAGPHDINLLLQVVNVLLLFWVLQSATGRLAPSAMVAGLFALHPINVETVAWVAERKNLLSMLFLLLALAGYRWYVSRPGAGRYILVAVLFALGLMAKPQVITLPFLLLLWDYWPLRRRLPQTPDENDRAHFPARSSVQAGSGKTSAVGDQRHQRGHHGEGTAGRVVGAVAEQISPLPAAGELDHLLCALSG